MAKHCPLYGCVVIYSDCLECESKICKRENKQCWDCIHRIKQASNYRCEFTGNNLNTYYFMRSNCSKYEKGK